jgi:Ca-activated chloride channel family protein
VTIGRPELLWFAVLAPCAAVAALWIWHRRLDALAQWASRGLWDRLGVETPRGAVPAAALLLALAVAACVAALALPRWGTKEETVERRGVDVVFVLDSSLSMAAEDARPSRLAVARGAVRRIAADLPGHRVALIQVEGTGQVLAPLTLDTAVIDLLLDAIEPATLPKPGTQLSSAFQQALRLFPEGDGKHRVLVLVTDGEDHEGGIEELLAAARKEGVVVHALGVGSLEGAPLPTFDGGYKTDPSGKVVVSRLNERLLEHLAAETDGLYVRTPDLGTDLGPIVRAIDGMAKRTLEGELLTTEAERFQWPLALAALALLGLLALRPLRYRTEAG